MTATTAVSVINERPESGGSSMGLRFAVVCYALIALSPAPFYLYLRAKAGLPAEQWVGTTPFDAYLSPGLFCFGSAAVCSYLLLKRRASAVWPAAMVAAWKVLEGVSVLRVVVLGASERSAFDIVLPFVVSGLLVLLALFVRTLRRQGVLQ